MAIKSLIFDYASSEDDYKAEDFRTVYKCFMSNGVLLEKGDDLATNTKLKVVPITGGVRILSGVASVNGSQAIVENEDIPIEIDGTYKIVLEWNVVLNKFVSKYIDVAEPLKRTKTIHQLQLAEVQKSGATYTVTDTRADQNVCGYANRMLDSQAEYLRQRIDNIADYPIECGTSGIWTWEKYASGKAKCWGKDIVSTIINIKRSLAALTWYQSDPVTVSYPTELFIEAPNIGQPTPIRSTEWGAAWTHIWKNNKSQFVYQFDSLNNIDKDPYEYIMYYRAIGRWK